MRAKSKPLLALTAGDLMTPNVVQLPEEMPLRDAAHLLRQAQVSGAPVVDGQGRCVGVLSVAGFLRWTEEGGHGARKTPIPACPYQTKGRLLTGEEAVICTLAEGNCPLQVMRPLTGGRHTTLCTLSSEDHSNQQQVAEDLPSDTVRRYMTTNIVTAGPQTPLPKLSRMMIDAHIHRIIIVDEEQRPIGIVSSTDLLAAMAYSGDEQSPGRDAMHGAK
jgi:CBS domain-containing protein